MILASRRFLLDQPSGLDSTLIGKAQIHQSHVWPMLTMEANSFFRGIGLGHQIEIGLSGQNGRDAFTH